MLEPKSSKYTSQDGRAAALVEALREEVAKCGGSLPQGWTTLIKQRMSGATQGTSDAYYISPAGKRFRSRNEVLQTMGFSAEVIAVSLGKHSNKKRKLSHESGRAPSSGRPVGRPAGKQAPTAHAAAEEYEADDPLKRMVMWVRSVARNHLLKFLGEPR
ncbi:hypothetical protein CYMTET_38680, partial [Cymbomonas tetramitiformis]